MFLILNTPNLVSLDIQLQRSNYNPEVTPEASSFVQTILDFVDRSKCQNTLRRLSIRHCPFTDEELATLLHGLPFITHLTLENVLVKGDGTIFYKLCSPTLALPQLQVLKLLQLPPELEVGYIEHFLHIRHPGLIYHHVDMIFTPKGPSDSLKEVIVTYRKRRRTHKSDGRLWRRLGMLINVGPLQYLDD
jgi:hypothetical protein